MQTATNYGQLGRVCLIGHGSIGKGILPLIQRHFTYQCLTVIDPVDLPQQTAEISTIQVALTKQNFESILNGIFTGQKGFCVNLSVGTSSREIMKYCQSKGVLYIDTVKQEWEGYYSDAKIPISERTNYNLRQTLLKQLKTSGYETTAISCCGANPGMVSWFVKQALLNIAQDLQIEIKSVPNSRQEWAKLMMKLGVKGIHIAQRDTQRTNSLRPLKEFRNTWSVDGFISQGFHQPAELGWGTFQKWKPKNAQEHKQGCQAAIYLDQPGMNTMVKTWCPTMGPQFGFLVTHDESISISDYYTVRDENGKVIYRPTCHYAYHPCEDAVSSAMQSIGIGQPLREWKVLEAEIVDGFDELGVLVYGHAKNAYWYGSQLDVHKARSLAPKQNATGLQVSSAVLAGMVWALQNPKMGIVEPDQMGFERCMEIQRPYIEPVRGYYTQWTPLSNRANEFQSTSFDQEDPWQFKNVIYHK